MEYILMVAAQILQAWFRAINIKAIADARKTVAHLSWQAYGITWLTGAAIGIKSALEMDYIGIILWMVSGAIGLEIAMWKRIKY